MDIEMHVLASWCRDVVDLLRATQPDDDFYAEQLAVGRHASVSKFSQSKRLLGFAEELAASIYDLPDRQRENIGNAIYEKYNFSYVVFLRKRKSLARKAIKRGMVASEEEFYALNEILVSGDADQQLLSEIDKMVDYYEKSKKKV